MDDLITGTEKGNNDTIDKGQTTKTIALVLLWAFVVSIAILFFANFVVHTFLIGKDDLDFRKAWLELLKNALILLGTALTTVIGYYFGQREGSLKSAQAAQAIKETDQKAQQITKTALQERDQAAKTGAVKSGDSPTQQASTSKEGGTDIIIPS